MKKEIQQRQSRVKAGIMYLAWLLSFSQRKKSRLAQFLDDRCIVMSIFLT